MIYVLIVLSAGVLGGCVGAHFWLVSARRVRYLSELCALVRHLRADVMFFQDSYRAAMRTFESQSQLGTHIEEYLAGLGSEELTLSRSELSSSQASQVRAFFVALGRSDEATELMELDAREQEFAAWLDQAKIDHRKHGSLYIQLGALLGIALGLLII